MRFRASGISFQTSTEWHVSPWKSDQRMDSKFRIFGSMSLHTHSVDNPHRPQGPSVSSIENNQTGDNESDESGLSARRGTFGAE